MATVNLSSPWVKFYREIQAMFAQDEEVHVVLDEENYIINVFVDSERKYKALDELLSQEVRFGGVRVYVDVVPGNFEEKGLKEAETFEELYQDAFEGNPALSFVRHVELNLGYFMYVVFENKVVQFFNDDLGDIYGNCSTLYEDIAREIFVEPDGASVYYCTDVAQKAMLSEKQKEWPC